jgi:hypothetical protein
MRDCNCHRHLFLIRTTQILPLGYSLLQQSIRTSPQRMRRHRSIACGLPHREFYLEC